MWISSIFKVAQRPSARLAGILVITGDDRLFYSVFAASLDIGWSIHRARTVEEAWKGLQAQPVQVVIYGLSPSAG